ncbi:hypothetical protein ACF1BN_15920 [Streptomyces sp. NPDC014861]|uniref:hypothetical protein n=1 Tax=Streptomyces sp. NPDC014861 TaxID=3364923 RepID=UPI0036FEDA39
MTRCAACHIPLPAGTDLHACAPCLDRLRGMLAEIPQHLPLLALLLAPTAAQRTPGASAPTGRAHSPLPLRLDVVNLLGPGHAVQLPDPHGDQDTTVPIRSLLHGWAAYVASQYPTIHYDAHGTVHITLGTTARSRFGTGPAAWCHWLTAYLPFAAGHDWIGDLYQQIDHAVRLLRSKTDRQPRRVPRSAPCPACDVFGLVSTEGEQLIACEACGHRLTADQYRAHSAAVLPALTRLAVLLRDDRDTTRKAS